MCKKYGKVNGERSVTVGTYKLERFKTVKILWHILFTGILS
jgi:hypothetical protein